jgi:hypothetical protein
MIMAKKQTRRSISVSRTTYERLKSFCETNNISMSQFVETRVGDFLGEGATVSVSVPVPRTTPSGAGVGREISRPAPASHSTPAIIPPKPEARPVASAAAVPMTSAAARYAVEPPPPIIKSRPDQPAPKPAEKRPDQIFTF